MSASASGGAEAPRFGFVTQVEHTPGPSTGPGAASGGLADGIALFVAAEELGYDVGYVRVRHLQDALSSPLLFLAALGQHTRRIQLGTAVIPLRFENPGPAGRGPRHRGSAHRRPAPARGELRSLGA